MKVKIDGHHNSDFRTVTRRFKDRATKEENLAMALWKGIEYEASCQPWFEKDCGEYIDQKQLKLVIGKLVVEALANPNMDVVKVVHCKQEVEKTGLAGDNDNFHRGLCIWAHVKENNYGFGMAVSDDASTEPLTRANTDKYEVRWVTIVNDTSSKK